MAVASILVVASVIPLEARNAAKSTETHTIMEIPTATMVTKTRALTQVESVRKYHAKPCEDVYSQNFSRVPATVESRSSAILENE